MSVLIKICGLSTPETLDAALDAGADMVGFVFFTPSPRHVAFEAARALGERVKGRALKVALSVDAPDSWLAGIMAALDPDMLQLHGGETPALGIDGREDRGGGLQRIDAGLERGGMRLPAAHHDVEMQHAGMRGRDRIGEA